MKALLRPYIWYKFLNSVFTGLSTGAVFIIYGLLQPSVFSVGGLVLSLGTLLIAKYYLKLMKLNIYFWVSLFAEVLILVAMITVLILPKGEFLSLIYYSLFNFVFVFGTFLMRFESNLYKKVKALSAIDSSKQIGNLIGLGVSWMFYEIIKINKLVPSENNWDQVYYFHWLLLLVQIGVLFYFLRSFKFKKD